MPVKIRPIDIERAFAKKKPITKLYVALSKDPRPAYVIAVACGFPATRLSEYANARKPIPARHILALCRELKCEPSDILGYAK